MLTQVLACAFHVLAHARTTALQLHRTNHRQLLVFAEQSFSARERGHRPMSVALYARTEEEEREISLLLVHRLAPWLRRRGNLKVMLVSPCYKDAHRSALTFPVNVLRHHAVANSVTDLVRQTQARVIPRCKSKPAQGSDTQKPNAIRVRP